MKKLFFVFFILLLSFSFLVSPKLSNASSCRLPTQGWQYAWPQSTQCINGTATPPYGGGYFCQENVFTNAIVWPDNNTKSPSVQKPTIQQCLDFCTAQGGKGCNYGYQTGAQVYYCNALFDTGLYVHEYPGGSQSGGDCSNSGSGGDSGGGGSLGIDTSSLPNAQVGVNYSANIDGAGGVGDYNWYVSDGSLPPGLNIQSESPCFSCQVPGLISGTPTQKGTYNFTVTLATNYWEDSSTSKKFTITVGGGTSTHGAISINTNSPLPSGNIGESYYALVEATGGTGSYDWSVTSATSDKLPPGLTLSSPTQACFVCKSPAIISGTPTESGTYTFGLRVATPSGEVAEKQFTITTGHNVVVHPYLYSLSPNSGPMGTPVTVRASHLGTSNSVSFGAGVINGLPASDSTGTMLTFNVPFILSNCPIIANVPCSGAYSQVLPGPYKVSVSNSNGESNTETFTVTSTNPSGFYITTLSPLASGVTKTQYQASVEATGGAGSYDWNVIHGSLPPGLTLVKAVCFTAPCQVPVTISGIPTTVGEYSFTIQALSTPVGAGPTEMTDRQFTIKISESNCGFTSCVSTPLITKTLQFGMTDNEVKILQQYLNTHGFPLALAGEGSTGLETTYFGAKTLTAVKNFQRAKGLVDDGIVGPATRALIVN